MSFPHYLICYVDSEYNCMYQVIIQADLLPKFLTRFQDDLYFTCYDDIDISYYEDLHETFRLLEGLGFNVCRIFSCLPGVIYSCCKERN